MTPTLARTAIARERASRRCWTLTSTDVPHFAEDLAPCEDGGPDAEVMNQRIRAWLAERGFTEASVWYYADNADEIRTVMLGLAKHAPNIYYIMTVRSLRANHSIICCNAEIVHDPSDQPVTWDTIRPLKDGLIFVTFIVSTMFVRPEQTR